MPSLKEVRNRITSVNSTQQITKAMKMVAAAKLRRAQDHIIRMRPYAQKLSQMLATVSSGSEAGSQSPYKQERDVQRVLFVVITSDRGLCGGFNANVVKAANALLVGKYAAQAAKNNVEVMSIGKKGAEAFIRRGFNVNTTHTDVFLSLSFDKVKAAGEEIMADFKAGKFDVVEVIYNEFKNVATQIVRAEQLLPMASDKTDTSKAVSSAANYSFEPSEEQIIDELIPKALKMQLYKAVLDSNASEHGARMTAMDKATENAQDLLKQLRLEYNRSRQAAITKEILEIVGGAEALAGK